MPQSQPPDAWSPQTDGAAGMSRRHFLTASTGLAASLMAGAATSGPTIRSQLETSSSDSNSGRASPKTLLVKHATVVVTMDAGRREIKDGGLFIEDGIIRQVGPTSSLPSSADEILNLKDQCPPAGTDQYPPSIFTNTSPGSSQPHKTATS